MISGPPRDGRGANELAPDEDDPTEREELETATRRYSLSDPPRAPGGVDAPHVDPVGETMHDVERESSASIPTRVANRSVSMMALERATEAAAEALARKVPRTLVSATSVPELERPPPRPAPVVVAAALEAEPSTVTAAVPRAPPSSSPRSGPGGTRIMERPKLRGDDAEPPISQAMPSTELAPSSAPMPSTLLAPSSAPMPSTLLAPSVRPDVEDTSVAVPIGRIVEVGAPELPADPSTSDTSNGPLVGRVLGKRYRLDAILERSSRGLLYRGEHLGMHKRVAIKIVHASMADSPELFARLEREAIAGGHIQHPNVASATDLGDLDDGGRFLVLEYVRGRRLTELIEEGPLPVPRALSLARQLAAALDAAHETGVLHRNVSPETILVVEGANDVLKLVDFGFADVKAERVSTLEARSEDAGGLTKPGAIVGTPGFLPPEAALGLSALDARSDLFALGAVLFAMLAGRPPTRGDDLVETFRALRTSSPTMLAVPAAVNELLASLLAPLPGHRPPSALAVVQALDAILGPPPSAAPSTTSVQAPAYAPTAPPPFAASMPIPPAPALPVFSTSPVASSAPAAPLAITATGAPPAPRRRGPLWAAIVAFAVLAVGGALVVRSRLSRASVTATSASPPVSAAPIASLSGSPSADAARSTNATSAAPSAPPLDASVAPASPSTSASADLPSAALVAARSDLRELVHRRVAPKAEKAFLALADADPGAFEDQEMITSARDLVMLLEREGDKRANKVFDAITGKLGASGVDILYEIVQSRGGTRASKRATALLRTPEVLARGTSAARLAFQLRDAPCDKKLAMLDEAAAHGDGRTLQVLETSATSCFDKSRPALRQAIGAIRARLGLP